MPKKRPDGAERQAKQAGPGRAAKGRQVGVRLSAEQIARLELIAEANGMDLSGAIRMVLIQADGSFYERARRWKAERDRASPEGEGAEG